ncbi:MAG TPA: HDOD domain-containing protein [Telluria sp.]|jgi:HD-like signal output (HDOD) protein
MFKWWHRMIKGPAEDAPAPPAAPAHDAGASGHPGSPVPARAAAAPGRRVVSFDQVDRVNSAYDSWLFERADDSGLDMSPLESQVLAALAGIVASQQSGAALVRRMPGLIPQLLQSLRSDTFSGAALSRTISSDVVLVAAVVRLANASYQGTANSITSVEHAVMLIGQEGLRQLITSVAFRPIIDMNSGHYTRTLAPRLWEHAERCASANRAVADELGIEPFEAFLAGLLQNVGLIVALRVMDQVAKNDASLGSELFCAQLVRDARALTCSIGREWHFPDAVTLALAEQNGVQKGAQLSPLGQLLMLTDYLGKVRELIEHGRLGHADPALLAGLPDYTQRLYAALAAPEPLS